MSLTPIYILCIVLIEEVPMTQPVEETEEQKREKLEREERRRQEIMRDFFHSTPTPRGAYPGMGQMVWRDGELRSR
jgi:hypothetical protein